MKRWTFNPKTTKGIAALKWLEGQLAVVRREGRAQILLNKSTVLKEADLQKFANEHGILLMKDAESFYFVKVVKQQAEEPAPKPQKKRPEIGPTPEPVKMYNRKKRRRLRGTGI